MLTSQLLIKIPEVFGHNITQNERVKIKKRIYKKTSFLIA